MEFIKKKVKIYNSWITLSDRHLRKRDKMKDGIEQNAKTELNG